MTVLWHMLLLQLEVWLRIFPQALLEFWLLNESIDNWCFNAISIFSQFSFNWFILDTSFEGWFGEKKKNEFINNDYFVK